MTVTVLSLLGILGISHLQCSDFGIALSREPLPLSPFSKIFRVLLEGKPSQLPQW